MQPRDAVNPAQSPATPQGATPPAAGVLPPAGGVITVRRLAPSDSVGEVTRLLHRAYAKQMSMGLRPLAGRQSDAVTRQRLFSGECWVAVEHLHLSDPDDPAGVLPQTTQRIVGCILFHEVEDAKGPPHFARGGVSSFSQFAVDPSLQGAGIGGMLLSKVEQRAREEGAKELACSMAEADTALLGYYLKRGYVFVQHWVWPYTNYRSAILTKVL